MRSLLIVVVLLSLIALSHAGLISQRTTVPSGWTMMGRADVNTEVGFSIGLHTQNDAELNSLFYRVTDPASDEYLDYLSTAEVNARFGAREEDVQMVVDWLLDNGVNKYKVVHGAVRVITTSDIAAKLFNCEMRMFMHQTSGKLIARAWGKYSLPDEIHQVVEIVTGISAFPIPGKNPFKTLKPDYTTPVLPAAPDATEIVVPQTVMGMYRIREQTPGSASTVSQGVIEYEGQYFANTDTATFARDVGYTTTNTTIAGITRAHIVGTNNQNAPQIEAALDVEQISSVNLEAVTWFWIEDGTGWLYEFGTHILNFTGPPMVTSTSYGWWEGDQCDIDPSECQVLGVDSYGYSAAVNKLFQKIGLAGVSLLVASGDSGANGRTNEGCNAKNIRPEFPAASPFVTTVGATEIRNATYFKPAGATICANAAYSCIESGYEQAVSLAFSGFTSGGGFSNVTDATQQPWQAAAVTAYLNSGVPLPPDSYWNRQGRGEPDVAAVGHNGFTVIGGGGEPVGGTSMSSPIFAAIASLLNYIAFTKTGNSLGFLNPLLYSMWAADPTTFTDVTVGDNICPEAGCAPNNACKGFVATKGWDPVTGLGTPVVNRMEAYVSKLMDQVVERRAAKKAAVAAKANRHSKKSRKQ